MAASICSSRHIPTTTSGACPNPARIRTAIGKACRRRAVRADCVRRASASYRNRGDGTFEDVSAKSGIAKSRASFGFTAVAADFDDDGWQDIYLACDSTPSLFFHNNRDGTFTEEGLERGLALNPDGMEQAGMGLAVASLRADGIFDVLKTHFADDTVGLYRGDGKGDFTDTTRQAGLAVETRYVSWGAAFPDLDNDGLPDIFVVTGNVYPDTERAYRLTPIERRPCSTAISAAAGSKSSGRMLAGPALGERHSSRGMARGGLE